MSKLIKNFLKIAAILVLLLISFSARILINSCHREDVANLINENKKNNPIECISEFAYQMNEICPIYFESWARIDKFVINPNEMTIIVVIDDDYTDTYEQKTIVMGICQQFEFEISNMEKMQKDMVSENMMIKILICQSNGDIKETVVLKSDDFFVKCKEERNIDK